MNRATWAFLGALAVGASAWVGVACSSNTVVDSSSPTDAGGRGDSGSSTGDDGSSSTGDDGGTTGDDTGTTTKDCGTPPTLHPPKPDGGIFCPFSGTNGGKDIYCKETEQCCETPTGTSPSTCVPKNSPCPVANSTVWQCEDPADCPGSGNCCAHSGDAGAVTVQTDTCGPYLSKFSGTVCSASACTASELVVCEVQTECTSGTCTAVKPKANQIGVCH